MRVLMCHPSSELYGSDRMAIETAAILAQAGHEVHVVLPSEGKSSPNFREAAATVHYAAIPIVRKNVLSSPGSLVRHYLQRYTCRADLDRILESVLPDVVYVNTITQPVWVSAAQRAGLPIVLHVREAEWVQPTLVARALLRHLRHCTLVVANSRSTLAWVRRYSRLPSTATRVIYNGKDWRAYRSAAGGPDADAADFLVIGRLSPRKGQDIAIRALHDLGRVDATLTFVGDAFEGYEWFEEELHQAASEAGYADKVRFEGFHQDVTPFLSRCSHVVVPSRTEPFGTVALEGMAAGRIVIAADVEGLSEIVKDGANGYSFEPDDAPSLAQAMRRSLDASHVDRSRIAQGSASTVDTFSRERYAAAILDAITGSVQR